MKRMGFGRSLRLLYEAHMKGIRDRNAREDYVRDEGIAIGEARGEIKGEVKKLICLIRKMHGKQKSPEEIAELLEEELALVYLVYDLIQKHLKWSDEKIYEQIFQNKKEN